MTGMKQKKIALWLKGIVIVLALMGIVFFGGLTAYLLDMKVNGMSCWEGIGFVWYMAVLCYLILFAFWQVCVQIGRENSFSMENVRCFHRMSVESGLGLAGFVVLLIRVVAAGAADHFLVLLLIGVLLLCGVFIILCEALSRLIRYAYEVKTENELTI